MWLLVVACAWDAVRMIWRGVAGILGTWFGTCCDGFGKWLGGYYGVGVAADGTGVSAGEVRLVTRIDASGGVLGGHTPSCCGYGTDAQCSCSAAEGESAGFKGGHGR